MGNGNGKVPSSRRRKYNHPKGVSASGPLGQIFEAGLKGINQKSNIMEVKTVKTTKSDISCKNLSKSTTIWNQTVMAITQVSNDIFEKFQNSTPGPWLFLGFDFF